jgi:hypothetical protein
MNTETSITETTELSDEALDQLAGGHGGGGAFLAGAVIGGIADAFAMHHSTVVFGQPQHFFAQPQPVFVPQQILAQPQPMYAQPQPVFAAAQPQYVMQPQATVVLNSGW